MDSVFTSDGIPVIWHDVMRDRSRENMDTNVWIKA
jgi:hypothetical protein